MYPGTSEYQKNELAKQITNQIMKIAKKDEDSISIFIEEISETDWMEKVYSLEIEPNFDKLYKQPGY